MERAIWEGRKVFDTLCATCFDTLSSALMPLFRDIPYGEPITITKSRSPAERVMRFWLKQHKRLGVKIPPEVIRAYRGEKALDQLKR